MHFPQLPIELRQPADTGPAAIVERCGPRRHVLCVNTLASTARVHAGLDVTAALAREPALKLIARSLAQERKALEAVAAWAYQWSGDIVPEVERWVLGLEIGASLRYFGSLQALCERLVAGSTALGYTLRLGIAPTWEAAALLACSCEPAIVPSIEVLRSELSHRPLAQLALPERIREPLRQVGLCTIGEVLQIPHDSLARRFGPEVTDYLQRLLGERPEARRRFRVPTRYVRSFECAYPVDTAPALLFPLRRMVQELQGYLRGRDAAVEALQITLRHREVAPTCFELRTSRPQRDAAFLLPLLRERLERTTLPAPVLQIRLEAQHLVAPVIAQGDLFESRVAHDAQWSQLLDRLRARLGEGAIRELSLLDDHRPERAWCTAPAEASADPTEPQPERPVWLLEPQRLRELPQLLGHPERIESGWWEGQDQRRDYYLAQTPQGACWWVYRDLRSNEWFLHGIWA